MDNRRSLRDIEWTRERSQAGEATHRLLKELVWLFFAEARVMSAQPAHRG